MLLFCAVIACDRTEPVDSAVPVDSAAPVVLDSGLSWYDGVTTSVDTWGECLDDAECTSSELCTPVPGFATTVCSPTCPQGSCEEGTCLATGTCALSCETGCPDHLACATTGGLELCAGDASGDYLPCATAEDCPSGVCFEFGASAICLPSCGDGSCPLPELDVTGWTFCFDLGEDDLSCVLGCDLLDATACPANDVCFSLADLGFDVCIPQDSL